MTKTIIIHPFYNGNEVTNGRTPDICLSETISLSAAINLDITHSNLVPLRKINPATIISSGKLEEIKLIIKYTKSKLLIMDFDVTPVQQRNLERSLKIKVLDRIGLILEIFGKRASTKEGKLQVSLAQLTYQKSRLVKAWSHLERQRGGGGFTGGPGETQKEADRRMLDQKLKTIKKQLENVVKTRTLHRKARKKVPYPIIALAGYTNAGKSTLFNQITNSEVKEADMLFATLDPTLRKIVLPNKCDKIILSDTVGFISNLPTTLIKAFRATLEEVTQADIILHIRDISHPETDLQKEDVINVLNDLNIDKNIPIIEVFNKIDLLNEEKEDLLTEQYEKNNKDEIMSVSCSAKTGEGIDNLLKVIENHINQNKNIYDICIDITNGEALASCYDLGQVLEKAENENGSISLKVQMSSKNYGIFSKNFN